MKQLKEPQSSEKGGIHIPVHVDTEKIDSAIIKAKELVELLREANELIISLSEKQTSLTDQVVESISEGMQKAIGNF